MNVVNILLKSLGENINLKHDKWIEKYLFCAGNKKWLAGVVPADLLNRSIKDAVNTLVTINESLEFYNKFPNDIKTPDYGHNWGKRANYIEINNRAIAEMQHNKTKNGILSTIKLLPAIPPSAKSWANCIILSQIFPNIYGDGHIKQPYEENSIYGIKLNAGYSKNIINSDIIDKISPEKQFEAFNKLAYIHGLKTGFRTVISADQIKIINEYGQEEIFKWDNPKHQEIFINEHVKLVNLGFEAIFVDSAKHIGGYDMQNYAGVGALPEYHQMQYILNEIRKRSKCMTLSIAGEKTTEDFPRYENLGFTTGTAYISAENIDEIKKWSHDLKYHTNYAPGIEVSNDNDEGGRSYENRLHRIHNVLFGYKFPSDKLPSFMQMEDLFPLRYDTNTHHLMMSNPSYSEDNTPKSHWENLFAKDDGRNYNLEVAKLFNYAINL